MSDATERALAELRAVPIRADAIPVLEPAQEDGPDCCSGDRPGYQWHQRSGTLPACAASMKANRAYMNRYQHTTGRTTRAGRKKRSAA